VSGGILLLLAHPDDESFMAGGTAAMYHERGVRVALVCATRGQRGSAGKPPLVSVDELPAQRERELRDACAILGIHLLAVLDYQDQHLAEAPLTAIREQLVGAIRSERPRIVITFDPNGINGHTDHVAISRFAMDAVSAAADPRWMPEAGAAYAVPRVLWPPPLSMWEEWRPGVLAHRGGVDFIVDIRSWRDAKVRALRAHRTQHQSIDRCWFTPADSADILSVECFRQAQGPPLEARPVHDDIFTGL
jgi:LmbE family N-acetylglucosaminyl deacetylase